MFLFLCEDFANKAEQTTQVYKMRVLGGFSLSEVLVHKVTVAHFFIYLLNSHVLKFVTGSICKCV